MKKFVAALAATAVLASAPLAAASTPRSHRKDFNPPLSCNTFAPALAKVCNENKGNGIYADNPDPSSWVHIVNPGQFQNVNFWMLPGTDYSGFTLTRGPGGDLLTPVSSPGQPF